MEDVESQKKEEYIMEKKPFYKRWWFIAIVAIIVIGAFTGGDDEETETADNNEVETEEVNESAGITEENESESESELPEELEDLHISDVRDDTTGNWRKVVDSQNFNMPENAIAYYNEYMDEGEVHYLISFATSTTTMINDLGDMLLVDITEYEDREEHSADTIGSGMLLQSYNVYLDSGEIEQVE